MTNTNLHNDTLAILGMAPDAVLDDVKEDTASNTAPASPAPAPAVATNPAPVIKGDSPASGTYQLGDIVRDITKQYLDSLDMSNLPRPADIGNVLLTNMRITVGCMNMDRPDKLEMPKHLYPQQLSDVMHKLYRIRKLRSGDGAGTSRNLPVGIYMTEGPEQGIYVIDDEILKMRIKEFETTLPESVRKDALELVKMDAPVAMRTIDQDLIPVANGVYDYDKKELRPYDPEVDVFTSKSPVKFVPSAPLPVIDNPDGTKWDVESWLRELSSDPEVVQLLWEIIGAVIRPGVRWNKAAFFYSMVGNNGKGTLCELMRALVGREYCATIPMSQWGDRFGLEPLLNASAVITDENDVGDFAKLSAKFKTAVTQDMLPIDRKNAKIVNFRFCGMIVECINELPRTKDKTDSFLRRLLMVPFDKSFTGCERTYIKTDYVQRQDVLEYVLAKILECTRYYALSEPAACKLLLDEYKVYNDSVRQFVDEILPQCKWTLLPYTFLYSLYQRWFKRNIPNGICEAKAVFINHLLSICPMTLYDYDDDGNTVAPLRFEGDKTRKIRSAGRMTDKDGKAIPEPLIFEYEMTEFYNKSYTGSNPDVIATLSNVSASYTGLVRVS